MKSQSKINPSNRYLVLISSVLLLAALGYGFFCSYSRFTLPTQAGIGLFLLAAMAGLASLFSPCSFPLLVTLLARQAGEFSNRHLVWSAFAFTLGTSLFLLSIGTGLALGAGVFIAGFTFTSIAGRFLRVMVGLMLIVMGIWQTRGQPLKIVWINTLLQPLWRTETKMRKQNTSFGYGLYGFVYILAGFGWTGPILAGLALHSLTIAGQAAAFTAFATAAFTIVLVMAILVIAIGTAQTHAVRSLKGATRSVKRWGGIILILVGSWLISLAIWANTFAQLFPV